MCLGVLLRIGRAHPVRVPRSAGNVPPPRFALSTQRVARDEFPSVFGFGLQLILDRGQQVFDVYRGRQVLKALPRACTEFLGTVRTNLADALGNPASGIEAMAMHVYCLPWFGVPDERVSDLQKHFRQSFVLHRVQRYRSLLASATDHRAGPSRRIVVRGGSARQPLSPLRRRQRSNFRYRNELNR